VAGENLDLSSGGDPAPRPEKGGETRRFLGVRFACCEVYARIYLNRDGTAYVGNCPRCAKQVRFRVGPGGTGARFFTVS
jgi:hypothetical protein